MYYSETFLRPPRMWVKNIYWNFSWKRFNKTTKITQILQNVPGECVRRMDMCDGI